ncbi:MAG: ATP-binding cassette domain-containing protein, partial [Thermoguttaceae bacterium]
MSFLPAARSGDIVVRAEGLAKAYDRPLLADLDVQITRGQRWGLLGPNGSGKTTLLRCLLGLETPDAGHVQLGQGLVLGYFDQHLAGLDDEAAVADAIRPPHKQLNNQQRRDLLARFGIVGDTALQKVGKLSGGERCRVALARLATQEANFLVLDEPTNHLDLWARDALERALAAFDGTVLFVSHDRYFVNQVADHLLVVEGGRVRVIEGNYQAYQLLKDGPKNDPPLRAPTEGWSRERAGVRGNRSRKSGSSSSREGVAGPDPVGRGAEVPASAAVPLPQGGRDRDRDPSPRGAPQGSQCPIGQ